MSTISQFFSGGVKSVQRGTGLGDGTITITAVNMAKTLILLNGARGDNATTGSTYSSPYISATTSTSFTVGGASYQGGSPSATYNMYYSWQVIEFN